MVMQFPHFIFHRKSSHKKFDCIELDGEVIHEIKDLNEFHAALGYTKDIAKAGILPDEFVWEEFIKGTKTRCACLELLIVEYLSKVSAKFRGLCKSSPEDWNPVLAMAKLSQSAQCSVCKKN